MTEVDEQYWVGVERLNVTVLTSLLGVSFDNGRRLSCMFLDSWIVRLDRYTYMYLYLFTTWRVTNF